MWTGYRHLLMTLPAILLGLSACGTSYTAVAPRAPAGLLLACQDPALVADPNNATVAEINVERIRVAQAYSDCRQRHGDLALWVQGISK